MSQSKAEAIVARLLTNATDLKYGTVSVTANIHNGRIMNIVYSTTENTRENEMKEAGLTEDKRITHDRRLHSR